MRTPQEIADAITKEEMSIGFHLAASDIVRGIEEATAELHDELKQVRARIEEEKKKKLRRGVYIASKTKHSPKWIELRDRGYPLVSSWIDEAKPGATESIAELWIRCIREASNAKALILYQETGEEINGALVEVGAALVSGVPVYACVAEPEQLGTFLKHPLIQCCSWDDALEGALQRYEDRP